MAVVTIGRLSEEILKILSGGEIQTAANISTNEIKISIGQVLNQLLKIDYISVNGKSGELIPNGAVLAEYTDIVVEKYNGKSRAALPIKPLKLPRDIGTFSVYPSGKPDKEFIPLQIGQSSLIKSQDMISDLLGQVGRETHGGYVVFTKDITVPNTTVTVDMKLVVMDISQYGDYDILPVPPEMEWTVKQEVLKVYGVEGISDMLVDATTKQNQNIPLKDQQQS